MSTITLSKCIDSDTLHWPELLPFIGHRVEIAVRDSEPSAELDSVRPELMERLRETCQHCQHANWDGEGAEAVSSETCAVAHRFLESLPREARLPTIAPEPDGQLNFEWYQA